MRNVLPRFRLFWALDQGGTALRQATMNHRYRGERRQRGEDMACREPLLSLLDQAMKLAEPTSQLVDCRARSHHYLGLNQLSGGIVVALDRPMMYPPTLRRLSADEPRRGAWRRERGERLQAGSTRQIEVPAESCQGHSLRSPKSVRR